MGKVRSYRITNGLSYFTLVSDNRKEERPIYVVEPYSQLYQHTQLSDGSPSEDDTKWKDVADINKKRIHKHCFIGYDYIRKEVTNQNSRYESVNKKKVENEVKNATRQESKRKNQEAKEKKNQKPLKRKANKPEPEATQEKKAKNNPTRGKGRGRSQTNKKR